MARTRYQQNETHCHRRTSEGIAFGENSSSILPCCFSRVVCRLALVFSSGTRSTGLRCCGRTWTRVSRTLDCRMLIWFNCTILSPWCLLRTRSEFLLSARQFWQHHQDIGNRSCSKPSKIPEYRARSPFVRHRTLPRNRLLVSHVEW